MSGKNVVASSIIILDCIRARSLLIVLSEMDFVIITCMKLKINHEKTMKYVFWEGSILITCCQRTDRITKRPIKFIPNTSFIFSIKVLKRLCNYKNSTNIWHQCTVHYINIKTYFYIYIKLNYLLCSQVFLYAELMMSWPNLKNTSIFTVLKHIYNVKSDDIFVYQTPYLLLKYIKRKIKPFSKDKKIKVII